MGVFSQRDWDLFFLWKWYKELEDESEKKAAVLTVITECMRRRILVDGNIEMIAVVLFGPEEAPSMLSSPRKPGSAVIDDWSCSNSLIVMYETHCGSVMEAGLKYLYAFENLCHNGVSKAVMKQACEAVCAGHNLNKYKKLEDGSEIEANILRQIIETLRYQIHLDGSIEMIGALLFGPLKAPSILSSLRKPGLAIVDDWRCLKSMVQVFETHCGLLTPYGMKHMWAFANLCNNGVSEAAMKHACDAVCSGHNLGSWHLSELGYSA